MTPVEFIEHLSRHFAKRHESDQAKLEWFREMTTIVRGTDARVLEKAYQLIRDGHEERAFPLPATLRRYVAQAADIVYPERSNTQPDGRGDWSTWTANAERLMATTDLGREAARNGWGNGMREFVCRTGRLPAEHEIGRLIEDAIYIDRCAAGDVDMGLLHGSLIGLAGKMLQRRDAIAERVLAGEVRT